MGTNYEVSGEEVRKSRHLLGLTQKELGEALGIAGNTVARWERGERQCPPHVSLALKYLKEHR